MTGNEVIKTAFSKEGLVNGGLVLGGLIGSELLNYGGDFAVRKASGDKYKMPHEIGGLVVAGVGAAIGQPIVAAAGLGNSALNLGYDLLGVNFLDPVGAAKELAGDVADKTTDGAAQLLFAQ